MEDRSYRPRARDDGLLVEPLGDELLVFDLHSDRAHSLNANLTKVWRACDGERDIDALQNASELDDDALQLALEMLRSARLLDEPEDPGRVSRRAILQKSLAAGAGIGVGIPAIRSIIAPTPAMAQSGTPDLRLSPGTFEGTSGGISEYSYDAGENPCDTTLNTRFTIINEGTGTSDTLELHGSITNDMCTGHALAPGGRCTFELDFMTPCAATWSHSPVVAVDYDNGNAVYIDLSLSGTTPTP